MAPVGPRLVLCEEKIREKSGLAPHRDLAELRSLSIPGTYQEKITHLGNSLMNLTGLKSLDLSRNSLVSLEGIQHLAALERLNLYYNCVISLAEVFRLHALTELRDVDFRLNPVVKNESDYRLFVVHMLPKLRQLDDRPVRASEREASWLHFASEGSLESTQSFPAGDGGGRPCHSRATCANSSGRSCRVTDVDDEAVLSLIAECEWDLSSPPGSTRSSQKERRASGHSPRECRYLLSPQSVQHSCGDTTDNRHAQRSSGSRASGPERRPQNRYCREPWPQPRDPPEAPGSLGPHTLLPPHRDLADIEDSAPSSQKSGLPPQRVCGPLPAPGTYRKRCVPAGRPQDCVRCAEGALSGQSGSEGGSQTACSPLEASEPGEQRTLGTRGAGAVCLTPPWAVPPGTKAALEVTALEALLDLVDKYWSGCKSLHSHELFLAQARRILSSVQELAAAQDGSPAVSEEVRCLALENESLHSRLAGQRQQQEARTRELESQLHDARKETDDLRQRLDRSVQENSNVKSLLLSMKKDVNEAAAAAALTVQITGLQASVQQLSGAVVELQQQVERQDHTQELTRMLQESHSSLVSSNEQLLQELGRARALHRAEVAQLHWSYKALRRTLGLAPSGSTRPPCSPDHVGDPGCVQAHS